MRKLVLILLLGVCFAQEKPATKLPDIPANYQDKLKTLIIKQKDNAVQLMTLQQQYQQLDGQRVQLNQEGVALQNEVLKSLGLDVKKYTIVFDKDKLVVQEAK